MSLSTTLSNVLIEGNVIDSGFSTTDNSTSSSYLYANGILTNADCKIIGNNFAAIVATPSAIMISISACSCIIQHNTFVRGSSSVGAYIDGYGSFDHIITDNIFDQPTTNGTNLNIVRDITNSTIYERNKNQIGFITIPLYKFFTETTLGTNADVARVYASQSSGNFGLDSASLFLFPFQSMIVSLNGHSTGSNTTVSFNFNGPINQFVPTDTMVKQITVGFTNSGANSVTGNGESNIGNPAGTSFGSSATFQLKLLVSNPTNLLPSTLAGSLMDVYNNVTGAGSNNDPGAMFNDALTLSTDFVVNHTPVGGHTTYTDATFNSQTVYLTLNNSSNSYINNLNQDLYINLQVLYYIASGASADVAASPVLIQYIW